MRYANEEMLKGAWLSGLKLSIRQEILMNPGLNLASMLKLAQRIDQRNTAWADEGVGYFGPKVLNGPIRVSGQTMQSKGAFSKQYSPTILEAGHNSSVGSLKPNALSRSGTATVSQGSSTANQGGFRRISNAEATDRRNRGLCFRCEEKWTPEHRCASRQLHLIMDDGDGDEDEATKVVDDADVDPELVHEEEERSLQLTMHSMMGLTSNQSMKVWGEVEGERLEVLIDCGASSNFMKAEVVQCLGLKVERTPTFKVVVGDGHKVECSGVCRKG